MIFSWIGKKAVSFHTKKWPLSVALSKFTPHHETSQQLKSNTICSSKITRLLIRSTKQNKDIPSFQWPQHCVPNHSAESLSDSFFFLLFTLERQVLKKITMRTHKTSNLLLLSLSLSICTILSQPSYKPTDIILLDCGSSGNRPANDGRLWTGDAGSKLEPVEKPQNLEALTQTTTVESIPYMTASLSPSPFTYTFPIISSGPIFVRFYFYSASYGPGFDRSAAFFSVKAGPYSLLANFSASVTADSIDQDSFTKEFIINIAKNNALLTFTFTPSPSFYAFVNGIEIVSMPTDLYYAPPPIPDGASIVGSLKKGLKNVFAAEISNRTALETVYRLDVGGMRSIPPTHDSGLFRSWSDDSAYILNQSFTYIKPDAKINYSKVPSYTAPPAVYASARTMGLLPDENKRNNLTWRLPVDWGFSYLIRLHFCEYKPQITARGDRSFIIYIDNRTADDSADVIKWSGGNWVAVYRDFFLAVVTNQNQSRIGNSTSKYNLFIDLHPDVEKGGYTSVILNGIEMFRLNDSNGNLGTPNPPSPLIASPASSNDSSVISKKPNRIAKISIAASLAFVIVLVSVVILGFFALRRKRMREKQSSSLLPEKLCREFTLSEIRTATDYFSHCIGVGGFGKVYKGHIDDGTKTVAIKRLSVESKQGAGEVRTEIETLSKLRHRHLVSFIGYCEQGSEKILVYDYMPNGTFNQHLYGSGRKPLSWDLRLQICLGAARGLDHLHTGAPCTIVHRDVKTTNILLDEKWVAKVSDFGLSKVGPITGAGDPAYNFETLKVRGTFGYLDPEYARCLKLTEKSDVYSFGVVLLEAIFGRKAVDYKLDEDKQNLANWAKVCIRDKTLLENIDPYLTGQIGPRCFRKFLEIAQKCIRVEGLNRPTMRDVVGELESAIQLQSQEEGGMEKLMAKEGNDSLKIYEDLRLEGGDDVGFTDSD